LHGVDVCLWRWNEGRVGVAKSSGLLLPQPPKLIERAIHFLPKKSNRWTDIQFVEQTAGAGLDWSVHQSAFGILF
jgi:hypothetical protein